MLSYCFLLTTFLLLGCSFSATADPMKFDITLQCDQQGPWCIDLTIFELDSEESHDHWLSYVECTNNSTMRLISNKFFPTGDGWFEWEYEVTYNMLHSCGGGCKCVAPKDHERIPIIHNDPLVYTYNLATVEVRDRSVCTKLNTKEQKQCNWDHVVPKN